MAGEASMGCGCLGVVGLGFALDMFFHEKTWFCWYSWFCFGFCFLLSFLWFFCFKDSLGQVPQATSQGRGGVLLVGGPGGLTLWQKFPYS